MDKSNYEKVCVLSLLSNYLNLKNTQLKPKEAAMLLYVE